MKKLIVLGMACLLALSFSVLTFACESPNYTNGQIAGWENEAYKAQTDVHAVVEPFANASFGRTPFLEFEGAANESVQGAAALTIIRNATVDININGTTLTQVSDINGIVTSPDTIDTAYGYSATSATMVCSNAAGHDFSGELVGKGTNTVYVGVKGTLGAIDKQAAGSYKSTINVTITSPLKQPTFDNDHI
jgi:hypothetical protein